VRGVVTTDFGGFEAATSIVMQPDGKIVAAGGPLARYNRDGTLDPGFGTAGKVIDAGVAAIALQPDGKIVGVASVLVNDFTDF